MKQLIQTLQEGEIRILDVPPPILESGRILVKNYYSLISPGTEGSTVRAARKSLVGKAKERPEKVRQVIEAVKTLGPIQAFRVVQKKLGAYSPLGYSCSGEIIDVSQDSVGFVVGDLVACGGAGYANHAEIVTVPKNLCVKLPGDADMQRAAYNTLGAVALQGVRQADLKIGETCAVIGLGLIGQLTCLLLRSSGIRVIGVDIDPRMVDLAGKHCADLAMARQESNLLEKIMEYANGIGVDAVILTAGTKSLDPINTAGRISRHKGRVVVVGDVPTGFERDTYYKKELELRMSCSYGPGRYDLNYEEKGLDYPVGYVRWTEKRNMTAFQEFLYSRRINIDYLTTHIFDLQDAPQAYDLILRDEEPVLGILIKYDIESKKIDKKVVIRKETSAGSVNIAFIGTGSYAHNHLLPNLPKGTDISRRCVFDLQGTNSRKVAEKYGFESCTSDERDIFNEAKINTVFVATRHDSHADYVVKCLKSGKSVSVEKPLCLDPTELEMIKEAYDESQARMPSPILMVGFNRRFSPLTRILKESMGEGPMAMLYRINAGHIPSDSWIQDREIGGGRIIGEVCHFVDYLTFMNGSPPESVSAVNVPSPDHLEDNAGINLRFRNGSIGSISYFSTGSRSVYKEHIEIYKSGLTGIIKDFKSLEIYGEGKKIKKKLLSQDKGQKLMIEAFINAVKEGKPSPIRFDDIYLVTLATFKIVESLKKNSVISL
jgi:predicted dehydrogenase/threonine dehydrogenase-like Zn-dependent dehydrogenase